MEIKVKAATGSSSKTASQISLTEGLEIPDKIKAKIKADVGDYLVEQILAAAAETRSPIKGESWPGLSAQYKKKKQAEGLGTKANLVFEGDLLDAVTWKETSDGIEIGWFGKQAAKADGHANISGNSLIPTRRLIPDEGQSFKPDIQKTIERIIADHLGDHSDGNR